MTFIKSRYFFIKSLHLSYSFRALKTTMTEIGSRPKKNRTKADFFAGLVAKQTYERPDQPVTFQL